MYCLESVVTMGNMLGADGNPLAQVSFISLGPVLPLDILSGLWACMLTHLAEFAGLVCILPSPVQDPRRALPDQRPVLADL